VTPASTVRFFLREACVVPALIATDMNASGHIVAHFQPVWMSQQQSLCEESSWVRSSIPSCSSLLEEKKNVWGILYISVRMFILAEQPNLSSPGLVHVLKLGSSAEKQYHQAT